MSTEQMGQYRFFFALEHLHLEWDKSNKTAGARLMQDQREIPPASKSRVNAFLSGGVPNGRLPSTSELSRADGVMPGLQAETGLCFHALAQFSAKLTNNAARCAYEALSRDPESKLARQLLSLLLVRSEVRSTGGVPPDVPGIVQRECA